MKSQPAEIKIIHIIFFLFTLSSCCKDNDESRLELLIGSWQLEHFEIDLNFDGIFSKNPKDEHPDAADLSSCLNIVFEFKSDQTVLILPGDSPCPGQGMIEVTVSRFILSDDEQRIIFRPIDFVFPTSIEDGDVNMYYINRLDRNELIVSTLYCSMIDRTYGNIPIKLVFTKDK